MNLIRESLWAQLSADRQDGKLCTMFLFEGIADPQVLHVTHKYFGKEGVSRDAVKTILNAWFMNRPFEPFRVLFDRVEMLGEKNEVKVLLPAEDDILPFLPGLKRNLDLLKVDKWPKYIPHVSVNDNMDQCDIPIVDFALVEGGNIVWRASEMRQGNVPPTVSTQLRSIRTGSELGKRKKGRKMSDVSADIKKVGERPKQAIQTPKVASEGDVKADPKSFL